MEEVQSAPYTRFCPTPAVLKRIHDFGFGVHGLSILHFKRLDHQERLLLSAKPVDLSDFSSKAKLHPCTRLRQFIKFSLAFNRW